MRVGLISCSAGKLDHAAPARELYTGPLFVFASEWISENGSIDEWAILSAKHGLVMPDDVIEPYDLALHSLAAAEQRVWCERVGAQLMERWGDRVIYTVLAGADYRAALRGFPMVEDVIHAWTERRRNRGMRRPSMGIGVIKKRISEENAWRREWKARQRKARLAEADELEKAAERIRAEQSKGQLS